MTAPQLAVYQDGGASVTGDGLNTFAQTADTVAELRGLVGVPGMQVFLRGYTAPNDAGQGPFYWNATGTAADDGGVTTVVPSGAGAGVWSRINGTPTHDSVTPVVTPNTIIQTGFGSANLSNGIATVIITFPVAFPTACLAVVASDTGEFGLSATGGVVYGCLNITKTGFTMAIATPGNPAATGLETGRYIAIGY